MDSGRRYPFYTLDVFTDRRFGGNPLAVFPVVPRLDEVLRCEGDPHHSRAFVRARAQGVDRAHRARMAFVVHYKGGRTMYQEL